jgi:hypothetical protein
MDFLKRCPKCGRRFGVVRTGRRLEGAEQETEASRQDEVVVGPDAPRLSGASLSEESVADEERTVERDTFVVSFHCKKCGQSWTEAVTEMKPTG